MHLLYSKIGNKKISITWSNTIPHISLHPSKEKKLLLYSFVITNNTLQEEGGTWITLVINQQQTCSSSRTISICVSMDKKSFSSISTIAMARNLFKYSYNCSRAFLVCLFIR